MRAQPIIAWPRRSPLACAACTQRDNRDAHRRRTEHQRARDDQPSTAGHRHHDATGRDHRGHARIAVHASLPHPAA